METPNPDLWSSIEAYVADVGLLAAEGDRYRRVRTGGGPGLLDESLALAREARQLYRHRPHDLPLASAIADRLRSVVERYAALLREARTAREYEEAIAAFLVADGPGLRRLIPRVFADAVSADDAPALYYPVAVMGHRNRPLEPAAVVERLLDLRREGFPAAEPGTGTASDEALRAIVLSDAWAALDTPLALRLPARSLPLPRFRLATSSEVLIHADRLQASSDVVMASEAPGADRWPDVGVDYDDYRDVVLGAAAGAGLSIVLLPP